MLPWQGKGCVPFLRRALGDGARTLSFGSIFRISTIWKCPDVRERFPRSGAKYICTITGLLTAIRLIREALDLQEQFPPIHPKQHEPVAQQNHAAPKEGLQSSAGKLKKVPAQVDLEAAIQKSFHEMRDAVRSNRVHADDNQRERPFLETLYIDHPTESGQEQEADASAEDGPRRRPDAFHHWANVRIMQRQSQRNPRHAGNQQLFHRNVRPGVSQPAPCDQAQDHRAQRRNETQREVSTGVVHEGIFAREQVQEPLVEAVAEIVVLVPVRRESREVVLRVPRRGNAYALPIEIRGRRRIQGPRQPVSEENQGERPPYPLERFHL